MNRFIVLFLVGITPHLAMADEVSSKIERLRGAIMPTAFAVGGLMAVVTLLIGMFSEKIGWSPFLKVLGLVGTLCVVNGLLNVMRNSLGGI